MSKEEKSQTGNSWKDYVLPCVYGPLMVLQVILVLIYYNYLGLDFCCNVGWIVLAASAVFGWLPILTLRRKGGVSKGKSYVHTTVLVDSGIYALVRHPQYLAGILIILALILISQHWLSVISGVIALPLYHIDARRADKGLIAKFGEDYKRYMQKVPRMNFVVGIIRLLRRRKKEQRAEGIWTLRSKGHPKSVNNLRADKVEMKL